MTQLFLNFLNMSIAAGWIVLAVLLLRPLTRKLPKWIHCLLWGIAGLRLILPVFPVSVISLLPSSKAVPLDLNVTATPSVQTGVSSVNTAVNTMLANQTSENMLSGILEIAWVIWIIGVAVLLLYACISSVRLRMQVRASLQLEGNVYICDQVASPFIYGTVRPRIYLPSDLDAGQREYVLAHENAHLRRLDHLWKPIGFALLSLYWFHPLLWVGYVLLCRDIEQACDEKVICQKDGTWRKHYSETLAACSIHRRLIILCPVAFGEIGVKNRIKGILFYKKPALWIIVIAILCCSILAAGFLTDPLPCDHSYQCRQTQASTCTQPGENTFTCTKCQKWYTEPIPLLPHCYDNGHTICHPTCTAEGTYQRTCISCADILLEVIPVLSHTAGETFVYEEPNCAASGLLASCCTVCGQLFAVERLMPNGVHDLQEAAVQPATCSEEGYGILSCSRCSYREKCVYEKVPHDFVGGHISWGFCESSGLQTFHCTQCDATYMKRHSPRGHNFVTSAGGKRRCEQCGWVTGPSRTLMDEINSATYTGSGNAFPVVIWDFRVTP